MNHLQSSSIVLTTALLGACVELPEKVEPVQGFDAQRYLGTWYEVARLDHSFERGLSNVTAHYGLRDDGGIKVINRGCNQEKGEWDEAEGKAYFVGDKDEGFLKVSFFGPFYGTYAVFELDQQDYQYSFVSGPDTDYLWLLSRTPEVSESVRADFLQQAADRGFATEELIWVEQGKASCQASQKS
ncbi:lipocalin family protein [Halopseudomonas sp.]|uniref:lipocalin family protein n=1 Tax=Halopseudomonas sp. TaxID=2901191 RepID=UPI003003A598